MGAFDELTLEKTREPIYDRFHINHAGVLHHILFQDQLGSHDSRGYMKDIQDTNMTCPGMLGVPLAATWNWIRLVIEDWCHYDDVRRFLKNTKFELTLGQDRLWIRKSLSVFEPIIVVGSDAGREHKIDMEPFRQFVYGKELAFWPWLEDQIEEIQIHPTESFRVTLNGHMEHLRGPIVGKVLLGPWLFRPPRKPRMGGGSLDDIDLGGSPEEPLAEA